MDYKAFKAKNLEQHLYLAFLINFDQSFDCKLTFRAIVEKKIFQSHPIMLTPFLQLCYNYLTKKVKKSDEFLTVCSGAKYHFFVYRYF